MLILKPIALSTALLAMTIAAFSSVAVAQDQNGKDLQAVLKTLQGTPIHLTADVKTESPKGTGKDKDMSGMMGMMGMMLSSSGGTSAPAAAYTGQLNVEIGDDGTIIATGGSGPSQVKVMHDGDKKLLSQTYSANAYDLGKLLVLLRSTLDVNALIEELELVKRVRVKDKDGVKTYRATIAGDYFDVKPTGTGGAKGMQQKMVAMALSKIAPGIIEGVLTADVDSSGALASLKFELQYSDPMKNIVKNAMKKSGANAADLKASLEQTEGSPLGEKVTVTYMVTPDASAETLKFGEEAAMLLKSAE